jgi:hypothetical protein
VRILATQEAEIRRITVQSNQIREIIHNILSPKEKKKNYHTKGLVEWLKVLVLSSNPSTKQTKTPEYKKKRAVGVGSRDIANCATMKSAFSNLGAWLGSWPCSSLWARNRVSSYCFPDLRTGLKDLADGDPRWVLSLSLATSIIRT